MKFDRFTLKRNPKRHGIGLVIDCETTGFSPNLHAAVEVGMVKFVFERSPEREFAILGITDEYHGLRDPGSAKLDPVSMRINGLSLSDLRGKEWEPKRINALVRGVELVVAHNASFDRNFLTPLIPQLKAVPWLCSCRGVDWQEHGVEKRSLKYLAMHFQLTKPDHSAFGDATSLLALLLHRFADGTTVFAALMRG